MASHTAAARVQRVNEIGARFLQARPCLIDRRVFAAGGNDTTFLDDADSADRLRSHTSNSVTAAQWRHHAPEVPQHAPCPWRPTRETTSPTFSPAARHTIPPDMTRFYFHGFYSGIWHTLRWTHALCEEIMREVGAGFDVELREFNGEADHVHLLVHYPPKVAVPS
jgi:hypothetical protein